MVKMIKITDLPYQAHELKSAGLDLPKDYMTNVKYGFFRNLFGKYSTYYAFSFLKGSLKVFGGFLLFYYPLDKIHCNIRRYKRNLKQ